MYPDTDKAVIAEMDFYRRIHTGYDLIYNPNKTKFMQLVEEAGGAAFNGLKMLLYQGIIAYELWNQVSVSEEQAEEVYKRLKESL
ncbi:MAG: shikimate dehydrogenase, partial [Lachnospiraceae bacterium]|nr:shikimate dehydrogenase [Lachnospiraceae bacterium]